ncbi:MAG TPA: hypothetical protein VFE24_16480, partial [Pirellulales bacterium]|nr:hypothetical protein [Pirellulales bacterium]
DNVKPTRQEYVQHLLTREQNNLLQRLAEKYRLQAYQFQRAGGADSLKLSGQEDHTIDPKELAGQLTTAGKVTAIGDALKDLSLRRVSNDLAGVVVFSDFGQNNGLPPVGPENAPSTRIGVPIYTVGVGPTDAVDLTVDLQVPPVMKKDERSTVGAIVRSTGLEGRRTHVTLTATRVDGPGKGEPIPVGDRDLTLSSGSQVESFEFTPKQPGRYLIAAEATGFPDVQAVQNNRAEREVIARDDFLRLMYVEYEPTWEWRFIKEVFHRDPLVGERGFRTFLRSADAKVRQTNQLFLPTLTPKRSDFFATDVIFIGDMPPGTLTPRFCEMTREFVEKFGGGLVIISGPRFGPGVLADTALADMLPVIVDPNAKIKDQQEFTLQLTPAAAQHDFMRLGSGTGTAEQENAKAWGNLGRLPWYQPVLNKQKDGVVLAEHPTDLCNDDKTHQPLIAIRRLGRGEVVYLAMDETWRLRRKFGELYYRQFWGQMIHRLGLSHLLGEHQRFVVRTDQQQYKEDDKVTVTIEAYDANYEPLTEDKLADHRIQAELMLPKGKSGDLDKVPVRITQVREAVYEARFPVSVAGEHRLRVKDPVTNENIDVTFQVSELSSERRSAVRDANLQREIAQASGGKTYTLDTVDNLPDDLTAQPKVIHNTLVEPLWNNWLAFGILVALMLCEWFVRKMINLP